MMKISQKQSCFWNILESHAFIFLFQLLACLSFNSWTFSMKKDSSMKRMKKSNIGNEEKTSQSKIKTMKRWLKRSGPEVFWPDHFFLITCFSIITGIHPSLLFMADFHFFYLSCLLFLFFIPQVFNAILPSLASLIFICILH